MYTGNNKGRGLSASLASRLSQEKPSFRNKVSTSHQERSNSKRTNIQSRLGLPGKRKDSIGNRFNSRGRDQKNEYKPPINLLRKQLKSITPQVASDFRNKRLQSRTSRRSESVPFRINNGAVVKGLRSDQLLLEKYRRAPSPTEVRRKPKPITKTFNARESPRKSSLIEERRFGRMSLDYNSGLMVSFANDRIKKNRPSRSVPTHLPEGDEYEMMSTDSESSSVESRVADDLPPEVKASLKRIGVERPPPPKPHRQVLDDQVQKEIAVLQGNSHPTSCGAGPGVKNFKMIPNLTQNSLSQRFTVEKNSS